MIEIVITGIGAAAFGYIAGKDIHEPQFKCGKCGVFNRGDDAHTLQCYRCGHEPEEEQAHEHEWQNGLRQQW